MSAEDDQRKQAAREFKLKIAEFELKSIDIKLKIADTEIKAEEAKLKAATLALETEKFIYARFRAYLDRLGTNLVRGASSLLVANGSTLLICLNYYKPLVENFTKPVLYSTVCLLWGGLYAAILAFISAISISIGQSDLDLKKTFDQKLAFIMFGISAVVSVLCFGLALGRPINFLATQLP